MARAPHSPGEHAPSDRASSVAGAAVERGLAGARALVIIPIVVLVLAALGAFVYGADVFVDYARRIVEHPSPVGDKIGLFLPVVDLFLVGATLLIIAIGFYELFIPRPAGASDAAHMPAWLEIHDLDDLKARVLGMVVLVVAVTFVESIVDLHIQSAGGVLDAGIGVAVLIAALALFLRLSGGRR